MNQKPLHLVGLTGGVASGKSIVASEFQSHSIPVLNLDDIGRRLMADDSQLVEALARVCGPSIVGSGSLDRKKMRELIFYDDNLRRQVEAVLHPAIWSAFLNESRELKTRGAKLVVCEAALLIESAMDGRFEELVVVIAPTDLRKQRLIARDRIDDALADQILKAQTDDPTRRKKATFVLTNHGSEIELRQQSTPLVAHWKAKHWL